MFFLPLTSSFLAYVIEQLRSHVVKDKVSRMIDVSTFPMICYDGFEVRPRNKDIFLHGPSFGRPTFSGERFIFRKYFFSGGLIF